MDYRIISELKGDLMWIISSEKPPLAIGTDRDTLRVVVAWGDRRLASSLPGERERTPTGGYEWYDDMATAMAAAASFIREAATLAPAEEAAAMLHTAEQMQEAAELGWRAMGRQP